VGGGACSLATRVCAERRWTTTGGGLAILRNGLVAGLTGTDDRVARHRRVRTLALAAFIATAATIAVDYSGAAAAPAAVRAAGASHVCATLGATKAVVKKIFGAGTKATTTTYCAIAPRGALDCETVECTDVFISPSSLSADVTYQAAEFKQYGTGHVSEVPVAGPGPEPCW
jgi:hypothetical protein